MPCCLSYTCPPPTPVLSSHTLVVLFAHLPSSHTCKANTACSASHTLTPRPRQPLPHTCHLSHIYHQARVFIQLPFHSSLLPSVRRPACISVRSTVHHPHVHPSIVPCFDLTHLSLSLTSLPCFTLSCFTLFWTTMPCFQPLYPTLYYLLYNALPCPPLPYPSLPACLSCPALPCPALPSLALPITPHVCTNFLP